jgi:hypothetical protein
VSVNAWSTLTQKVYMHRLPSYGNKIFYGLGFLTLTSLLLLVVSGAVLAFMGQGWWLGTPSGVYVRSVHLWSVQAFIALMILHFLVGFTTSGFRPPRRMVWVFGACIFCLALVQTEFGYGLRGDFSSQFRALSGADFWNGAYLGWWLNLLDRVQVYALHIAIIPLLIFMFFLMHYILERAYGIATPYRRDVSYTMTDANHTVMYMRGLILVSAVAALAYVFPSPYVPPLTIAGVAQTQPDLVATTLQAEYDRTSDTATYLDSIDPYTFDTRSVFVTAPYEALTGAAATSSAVMVSALMPAAGSGLYETILDGENPAINDTYTLRFLSDLGVPETRAGQVGFATEQGGMAKDENGHMFSFPPGSWWLAPLWALNSAFDLPNNDHGDRIAAEVLGAFMLLFIAFPYIPYLNRLPELLHVAPFIWRERRPKRQ